MDDLSADVCRQIRGKEQGHFGYVFGRTAATKRYLFVPLLLDRVGQLCRHVGDDEARGNAVRTDAARPHLFGNGFSQADHTGFGSRIVALSGVAAYTDDRRHVDDRAAALTGHDRRDGVDEVECRFEVDRQYGIPLSLGHTHHQTVFRDAGVVYQNIDVTEIFHDFVDNFVCIFEISRVRSIAFGFDAQCCDFGFGCFPVFVDNEVGERYIGALLDRKSVV